MSDSHSLDQVTLVDSDDRVIGVMDKIEAHRGEGKLHRAASVFLYRNNTKNGKIEVLIQQRSKHKIVGALQWANSCCGNVRPGESYEKCARRRLQEELGIESGTSVLPLRQIDKFEYRVQCNDTFSENEIDMVFVGEFDGEVVPNETEVADWRWERLEKLEKEVEENRQHKINRFVPWLGIMFERSIQNFLQQSH